MLYSFEGWVDGSLRSYSVLSVNCNRGSVVAGNCQITTVDGDVGLLVGDGREDGGRRMDSYAANYI